MTIIFGLESFECFASTPSAKPAEPAMKSIKVIAIFMFPPRFVSENSPIECQIPNVAKHCDMESFIMTQPA